MLMILYWQGIIIKRMDNVEKRLALEFEMTRMGKPSIFLEAKLVYDRDGV